jgi:5-methylcytosine-specific restriction endonuclease McrA
MLHALKTAVKQLREKRSTQWPALRRKHLAAHPTCASCGGRAALECHHIVPVSFDRSRELDPDNLITLCEKKKCHCRDGHLWDWKAANPNVVADAAAALARIGNRIYPGSKGP